MSAHGWAQQSDATTEATPDAAEVDAPSAPRLGPPPVYYPPGQQLSSDTILAPIVVPLYPISLRSFRGLDVAQRLRMRSGATQRVATSLRVHPIARIALSSVVTSMLVVVTGVATIGGIALGIVGREPAWVGLSSALGATVTLFAIPAVHVAISSALGHNGSYWAAVGGSAIGLSLTGLGMLPLGWYAILAAPLTMAASICLASELSHAEPATPPPTNPRDGVRMTRQAASLQIFPGLLLNETQRGLTLGGVF